MTGVNKEMDIDKRVKNKVDLKLKELMKTTPAPDTAGNRYLQSLQWPGALGAKLPKFRSRTLTSAL